MSCLLFVDLLNVCDDYTAPSQSKSKRTLEDERSLAVNEFTILGKSKPASHSGFVFGVLITKQFIHGSLLWVDLKALNEQNKANNT